MHLAHTCPGQPLDNHISVSRDELSKAVSVAESPGRRVRPLQARDRVYFHHPSAVGITSVLGACEPVDPLVCFRVEPIQVVTKGHQLLSSSPGPHVHRKDNRQFFGSWKTRHSTRSVNRPSRPVSKGRGRHRAKQDHQGEDGNNSPAKDVPACF